MATIGDIYHGLPYPIVVALMTTAICGLLLRDTADVDIKLGSSIEAAQRA